ncbi:MAG: excinuclease ABC subunit UvrA [Patescibacteria group bacterium]|nr:excinuclease ABC subunit UvrA [Patescibacteria group bacterium]
MNMRDKIIIKGASQNNLKNIDIEIPKHKLVVVTGVSGSGKSSLAFDTLYAEGYRRYVENLSSHARFFLHSVKKPKVKRIENLSPAIAVDQKSDACNPRSTIGTITDAYDFLRILYAGAGQSFCPQCGTEMQKQNEQKLINAIKKMEKGTQIIILGLWTGKQKTIRDKLSAIASHGYSKIRIDKKIRMICQINGENFNDDKKVQVIVDRISYDPKYFDRERLVDSLQTAAKISKGEAVVLVNNETELHYSKHYCCSKCGFKIKSITTKNFSFNSPEGACEKCTGLGEVYRADPEKVIPSKAISINEGAIMPWSRAGGRVNNDSLHAQILKALSRKYKFSLNVAVGKIPKSKTDKILYGSDEMITIKTKSGTKEEILFEGISKELEEKHRKANSSFVRNETEKYLSKQICTVCGGKRLKRPYLNVRVLGKTIDEIVAMEIEKLIVFFAQHKKHPLKNEKQNRQKVISQILSEVVNRLQPLEDVGLGYLNLDRSTRTLSGGEFQRVRLATQLFSGLSDVVYVLDEPSIGLHPRDTQKLIKTLRKLQKANNSIIVVEHDKDIINAADYIIDIGPKAGEGGGKIIFQGQFDQLRKAKTETARYLFKKVLCEPSRKQSKTVSKNMLKIIGASQNNLKNVTVAIPLAKFVSVVGVSGSGKSSLVNDIIAKALRKEIHGSMDEPGRYKDIQGIKNVSKIVIINQASIGRSPRSNAATYTGVFGHIRKLFSATEAAQKHGYTASYFSFNMRGGRCEYCQGEGVQRIEMHLLDDVYANCPYCNGTRYNKKMLEVQYHGVTIVDVLDMSVEYAYHFFNSNRLIAEKLKALKDVGLGYLRLGQNANELSGGEAQRIKLATELARKSNGNALYILDEPTVGLHFSDVHRLLLVLQGLVSAGNSVLVVEHNLDVIGASDWVIELGSGSGSEGGNIIFEGTSKKLKKAYTPTGKMFS